MIILVLANSVANLTPTLEIIARFFKAIFELFEVIAQLLWGFLGLFDYVIDLVDGFLDFLIFGLNEFISFVGGFFLNGFDGDNQGAKTCLLGFGKFGDV